MELSDTYCGWVELEAKRINHVLCFSLCVKKYISWVKLVVSNISTYTHV